MAELPPDVAEWLEREKLADEPSADDEARVARTLAITLGLPDASLSAPQSGAGSGPPATQSAYPAATTTSSVASAKTALITLGVLVSAAAVVIVRQHVAPHAAAPQPAAPLVSAGPTTPASSDVAPKPSAEPARPAVAPEAVVPTPQPPNAAPNPRLQRELRLLDSAARALDRDDTFGALRTLERHRRRFPDGLLVEEREGLRVIALCKAGQLAQAQTARARFEARAPRSPLRARIAQACDVTH
jgi:hypothetical protein